MEHAIIVHFGNKTQFSFINTEALFLWLKYDRKFTASEICELTNPKTRVHDLLLIPPGVKATHKRACVMLSGNVHESKWQQWKEDASVDYVAHIWAEQRHIRSFPKCAVRDDYEYRLTCFTQAQEQSPAPQGLLLVLHADDVAHVKTDMHDIAWVYAAAVLHSRCSNTTYDYFVRCRLDCQLPSSLDCGARDFHNWIAFKRLGIKHMFDGLFWGSKAGMQICLANDSFDQWTSKLVLPPDCLKPLKELVASQRVKSVPGNKSLLVILNPQVAQTLPGNQMHFALGRILALAAASNKECRIFYRPLRK